MKLKKKQEIKHESAQVSCPFFELRNSVQKIATTHVSLY